jgi:hypothetical protein
MSYDLMLMAGSGKEIDQKGFRNYFKDRTNYQSAEGQAVYQNEDTGVYFIFDEPEEGVVAFNLNYFRSHVFGLEAALELEQFVQAFGATVGDPQGEMGEDGVFTVAGFLKGWNQGNAFAYRAMLQERSEPVSTWPSERIQQVWEWNYSRSAVQEQLGDDIFVPSIFAAQVDGQLLDVAIWPPGCPILLPTVDAVLVPVNQNDEESQDLALVRWEELLPLLGAYEEQPEGGGLGRYRLAFEQWPPNLASFLNQPRTKIENLNGVGLDEILDQEMVEQASQP